MTWENEYEDIYEAMNILEDAEPSKTFDQAVIGAVKRVLKERR